MKHAHYQAVNDLPSLTPHGDGPELALAIRSPEEIIDAVVAHEAPGARLQEKVDGCWACGVVGADGRIASVTSRAGLPLRFAVRWVGQEIGRRWIGWQIIGELEVGTTRALRRREERGETLADTLDPWHVYGLLDPTGAPHEGMEIAALVGQMGGHDLRGRLRPIAEAMPGESWAAFAASVLDAGGEGLIVRSTDGTLYRAKPQVDFDRAVLRIVEHIDRNGHARRQAEIGVCTSAGARPRYRATQHVELPAGSPRLPRGTVVTIIGSSINAASGAVRFARIVAVREDKAPEECR